MQWSSVKDGVGCEDYIWKRTFAQFKFWTTSERFKSGFCCRLGFVRPTPAGCGDLVSSHLSRCDFVRRDGYIGISAMRDAFRVGSDPGVCARGCSQAAENGRARTWSTTTHRLLMPEVFLSTRHVEIFYLLHNKPDIIILKRRTYLGSHLSV